MTNLTEHPCANKCSEYKDEQCRHCLIQYDSTKSDFAVGDVVVISSPKSKAYKHHNGIYGIKDIDDNYVVLHLFGYISIHMSCVRHATPEEITAGHRLDHSVQQHEMITDSSLDRIEACYIQKKKQVELLQVEVTRLNDKIMQLEDENARLQKIIALHHESAIQEAERVQEIHALFVENL